MRPPSTLRECAAFLYREENREFKPIGSGANLVLVEGPHAFPYIVTCKHVVKDLIDTGDPLYRRLNRSDQPTGVDYRLLSGDWYFHPDPAVDVAVLSIPPGGGPYEVHLIDARRLLTDDFVAATGWDIGDSDTVFFPGLFKPYHGYERNVALYRAGHVACVTDEPIKGHYGATDYLLLEMDVFHFNSGAPLFAKFYNASGNVEFAMVGIVAGFFHEPEDKSLINAIGQPVTYSHFGISTAIPAQKIWEVLQMPEPSTARKKRVNAGRNADAQESAGGVFSAAPEHPFTRSDMDAALRKVSRRKSSRPARGKKRT